MKISFSNNIRKLDNKNVKRKMNIKFEYNVRFYNTTEVIDLFKQRIFFFIIFFTVAGTVKK